VSAERFIQLWTSQGASATWASALYEDVHELYSSADRHYHTGAHIQHCLGRLDEVRHLLDDPLAVELAIWFHDVIYEIGGDENERLSARFFLNRSRGVLRNDQRARVARHILATIHPSDPTDPDTQFIVDIDLSSFSLSWPQFLRDSVNVRRESTTSSHVEYAERQEGFLEELCSGTPFYKTDYYLEHHETQAQDNFQRILEILRARRRHDGHGATDS
jgi:predicted metal-dependent HD superfamily phosphohydrolase